MKRIPVLFENEFYLVLDKPAGLAVQGGEGVGVSLDSILSKSYSFRPLLVHRLDRDTSGLVLAAKNREAAAVLSSVFREKHEGITKQYLAVTSGIPNPPKGIILLDLEIRGTKKKSTTSYRLLGSGFFPGFSFSCLELELGTGRMHQIRRHLKFIECPVLGDDKYGDFSLNRELKKTVGLKRLLLHAARLKIPPLSVFPGGLDISSPLPESFLPFFEKAGAELQL